MNRRTAITVHRARDDVERRWHASEQARAVEGLGAAVAFRDAPGDRGTEIHLDLEGEGSGLGAMMSRLRRAASLAKAKDELRRFKQLVETGVIARSDGTPEGERAARKLKQRPAQPLEASELQKAGA